MQYRIDPLKLTSVFTLPCSVADNHLKLVGAVQLKVLLYIFRNVTEAPSAARISEALGVVEADVNDAIRYWCDAGVLISLDEPERPAVNEIQKPKEPPKRAVAARVEKPDRVQVAKRGLECPQIAFLLSEAQGLFGRCLRQSETSTLVWLYDDEGLSAPVLLMLIQYAVNEGKCNIGFIERTALDWVNSGVCDIPSAEQKLKELAVRKTAWGVVCRAFSIEHRAPSKRENDYAYKWVETWDYGDDILKEAYDACVDNTARLSFNYIDKVLAAWNNQGVKKPEDIQKTKKPKKADNSYATYDISEVEKLLID